MRLSVLRRFLHPRRLWPLPLILVCTLFPIVLFACWMRSWVLRRLPDLPEPFDVAAAAHVEISADQNAFELYRRASDKLQPMPADLRSQYSDVVQEGWNAIPLSYQEWLAENRDPLNIYREGSERPQAVYVQPGELLWNTPLDVTNSLRDLARLGQLEALRLEAAGNCTGAWDWHRTVLQSSRHSGRNGGLIERLVGCDMHYGATKMIARWSSLPGVDVRLLRKALDDIRGIHKTTVPPSETIKAEYVMFRKIFIDPSLLDLCFEEKPRIPRHIGWRAMWPFGEPEASHRVARLVFANWLSQCDLPHELRTRVKTSYGMLFAPDPNLGPLVPVAATAQYLDDLIGHAFLRQLTMAYVPDFLDSVDREDARRRLLETVLAVQIHRCENGSYPETLDQVVGLALEELPVDPFGGGVALRYRREADVHEGVTLWSIGGDRVDDDGLEKVTTESGKGDVVIRVRPPIPQQVPDVPQDPKSQSGE